MNDPVQDQHHYGLLFTDPVSGDTLRSLHADKYFTPASNIKIFTLLASLEYLPHHLPALEYVWQGDTLYFRGLGDPGTLHPYLQDSSLVNFLGQARDLRYVEDHFKDTPWGPGWAWEDYDAAFSPERSALPLAGNVVTVYPGRYPEVRPQLFRTKMRSQRADFRREWGSNDFFIPPQRDTVATPFRTSPELTRALLEDQLGRPVGVAAMLPAGNREKLGGSARDSVLRRMMHESDNFLAEQLLLGVAAAMSDTLDSRIAIRNLLEEWKEMPAEPRWVDGSGLSRYNLASPGSLVWALTRLYQNYPLADLQRWFPAGGRSGTLEQWYAGEGQPYVFAKSGTLGNVYCLSGFLRTRKGRWLTFSVMNNHFRAPQAEVRGHLQQLLEHFRDTY